MCVNLDIVKDKIQDIDERIDDELLDLLYYYFISRYCVDQINNKQSKDNKVKEIIKGAYFYCFCPFCGELIVVDYLLDDSDSFIHHCKNCNAELDWSDSILYRITLMFESSAMEESFRHEY